MTTLDWGLTAAAVLMLLFAIRVLMAKEGKDQLGCGFGIATALLWMWVLRRQLDDLPLYDAGRVGLGVLLVLPAAKALAQPKGARLIGAAISLVLAFVVAGPVVSRLWSQHKPDIARTRVEVLQDQVSELDATLAERLGYLDQVRERLNELEVEVARIDPDVDLATRPDVEAKLAAILHLRPIAAQMQDEVASLTARRADTWSRLLDAQRGPADAEPQMEPADQLRIYLEGLGEVPALDVELDDDARLEQRAEHQLLLESLTGG